MTCQFDKYPSDVRIAAEQLGENWTGPTGLVIDDFANLNAIEDASKRKVAEQLKKQLLPLDVEAVADFTYRRTDDPLVQVTLRMFVFETEDQCNAWWKKRYEYEGWEKHYEVVDDVEVPTLKSKQATKRIIRLGNVWLTCGELKEGDQHIRILNRYLKALPAERVQE